MIGAGVVEFVKEWGAVAGGAVTLVAIVASKDSLGALGRWRDRVFKAVFYAFLAEQRAIARAEKTEAIQRAILVELKTNGGASLKDAIIRIEEGQVLDRGLIRLVIAQDHSIAAFTMDHEGRCNWISPGYQKLTGRPFDEVKGTGWLSLTPEDERDHVANSWRSAVDGGYSFSTRFHVVRSDGSEVLVHGLANPLTTGRGVVGWAGLLTVETGEGWWKT